MSDKVEGLRVDDVGKIPKSALTQLLKNHQHPHPTPPDPTPPVVPPPHLDRIYLDSGWMRFDGAPAQAYGHLTLLPDGTVTFEGHFHDAGLPPYKTSMVWFVRATTTNRLLAFPHAGSISPFSRNDDWNGTRNEPMVRDAWAELSAGYTAQCVAKLDVDLGDIIAAVGKAVGVVASVAAMF